jgi:hypothetical protein
MREDGSTSASSAKDRSAGRFHEADDVEIVTNSNDWGAAVEMASDLAGL